MNWKEEAEAAKAKARAHLIAEGWAICKKSNDGEHLGLEVINGRCYYCDAKVEASV